MSDTLPSQSMRLVGYFPASVIHAQKRRSWWVSPRRSIMRGRGIGGGEPLIEWRDLIVFKRSFTEPAPAMKEKSFAESGIDAFHGRARFTGPRTVEVAGEVHEASTHHHRGRGTRS
jgi:pyruvate/2-oxoglutarate dehydrogenase complex dihydrolipoamide dehydrogenase (E3) component